MVEADIFLVIIKIIYSMVHTNLSLGVQVRKLNSDAKVEDSSITDTAKLNQVADLDLWIVRVYSISKHLK